jgi:hypothetical protein
VYRVWSITNPPNVVTYHDVASPEEGIRLIEKLANGQLRRAPILCNVFGLEVCEDGEWSEWHDEEGRSVGELEVA